MDTKRRLIGRFAAAILLTGLCLLPIALLAQEEAQSEVSAGGAGAMAITGLVLAAVGVLGTTVAGIWWLVVAFSVHWGWGLACLFVPFAQLAFLFTHWDESKKPFLANIAGLALAIGGIFLAMSSAPNFMLNFMNSGAMNDFAAQMERQMQQHQESMSSEDLDINEESDRIPVDVEPADSEPEPGPASESAPEQPALTDELKPSAVAQVPVSSGAVSIGDSVAQVRHKLGRPSGQIQSGDDTIMSYGGLTLTARNGQIVEITGTPDKVSPADSSPAEKRAATTTAKPEPKPKPKPKPEPKPDANAKAVLVIKNGGKRVEMSSLLVPGKITVVDFYADWCGPCRSMSPHLEALANSDPDVCLRKVDIVNWTSDVAKQYQLNSIPNVRVFDRNGRQIGEPTSNMAQVKAWVSKAK